MERRLIISMIFVLILLSGCLANKPHKINKQGYLSKGDELKEALSISCNWTQLSGMDGGDMHFIYSTKDNILFVSHGFGGVWRSEDGGKTWKMIKQDNFVDLNFYDMEEFSGRLYAGTNKGLWYSDDKGKKWSKLDTGFEEIDNGTYGVVSLAECGDKLFFTAVLDKAYRGDKPGEGKLLFLKNEKVTEMKDIPDNREITVSARYPYLFLSSPFSGLYVFDGKIWKKILDKKTTNVFVDSDYNLYVGTIGEWWYIGKRRNDTWIWEQVAIPGKNPNTIFYFLVPDPVNDKRLWFGCAGVSTFYSFSARGSGNAFVGVGYWDDGLKDWKLNPNYATSIAFYGNETVNTPYGKVIKQAFVTVGGQAVQKTEDGGLTWHDSYEGIYGDTINAINPINSGILSGSIVITAVSGIEIALENGNSWMEGVDFSIGRVNGELPGYAWCAISPNKRIRGKYDLLISTGYPSPYGGDGVFAINISALKGNKTDWIEKILEGPHYEMVIIGNKLYAGNMEEGLDVIDLETFEQSRISIGKASIPIVRKFDGKIFLETYEGKYVGDGWRWKGNKGKIYLYEEEPMLVYDGYAINFFVKNKELIALTQHSLIYKADVLSNDVVEVELPDKEYTDMAVDWEDGLIFLSTDGEGIFYTTIDDLMSGKIDLQEFNRGLLTLKIRNIVYNDGYLFAGTRGHSVWRTEICVE